MNGGLMKDEPNVIKELREALNIIKELREAEKFGRLQSRVTSGVEELEAIRESSEDVPDETAGFIDDDVERKTREDNTSDERTEKVSLAEERYRLITEHTNDLIAITTFTLNPTYTYVSPSHKNVLGYEPSDLIGEPCFDFIPPDDKKKLLPLLKKYVGMKVKNPLGRRSLNIFEKFEYRLRDKTGDWHYIESTANLIGDELLFVSKDVTERKKTEEKIKQHNIQLKKLDRIKTDFFNISSHELRTPMAAIKGYIQMLLKQRLGKLNPGQKDALNVVLRNTNRLDNLIEDILDISRLESGTMKFVPEKTDIGKMIKEVRETMQSNANLKNIKINTELEELPDLVVDQQRIKQVLMNLVDNALKFSPHDSTINLCTKMKKNDILFEVQDYGWGIPKNKQKKIFERFYQCGSSIDRRDGGVGLGLTISQGIVNAHGGHMWVDSALGRGSTFKFTLPVQPIKDAEDRFKQVDVFSLEK